MGQIPHYDVFIDAESPLGRATAMSFGTAPLHMDDPVALVELRKQRKFQLEMAMEDLVNLSGRDAIEEA